MILSSRVLVYLVSETNVWTKIQSRDSRSTTTRLMPTNTSRRGRGQSRKNRVYVFRQWLLQTYGSYLSRLQQEEEHEHRHINAENAAPIPSLPPPLPHEGARPSSGSTRSSSNRRRPLILDVAGGKGDLSWLLNNVDGFESIVVLLRGIISIQIDI